MLGQMIKKEFLQFKRDKRMLPIVFVAPIIQLIILGYAANFDVNEVNTAICDRDKTAESRAYLDLFFGSGYFKRTAEMDDPEQADLIIEEGIADVAVVIPQGFGRNITKGEQVKIQLLLNGSDTNYAVTGLNYITQITARYSSKLIIERLTKNGVRNIPQVGVAQRLWYNPELKSRNFMVPAIMGMLLLIITSLLTAMAIVKERENGTIEQLIVTPVKKYQVLVSKLVPYVIVGLIDAAIAVAVVIFWFNVQLKGSEWLLALAALLFVFNTLGIGLFISTISETQQQAMMAVIFLVMMPFIYFSGFVFPVDNMPVFFQYVSQCIPLTHFLTIIRALFLKGSDFLLLWKEFAALLVSGTIIFGVSISRFRKYI